VRPHVLAFLLVLLLGPSAVRAEAVPEHVLKATYIYNFAALTQWPPMDRGGFNICVFGDSELARVMQRLAGKTLHGRVVSVARLGSLAAIRECQVLYVAADEAVSLPRISSLLGDAPVLTVSDAPATQDAAVRIVPEGSRLAFEVDVERCRRAGLRPGAALLSLARNLRRPEH
jgi:hypothetical protein